MPSLRTIRRRAYEKTFSVCIASHIPYFFSCALAACYCRRNYSKLPCSDSYTGYICAWERLPAFDDTYRDYASRISCRSGYWSAYWLCTCGSYGLLQNAGQTALSTCYYLADYSYCDHRAASGALAGLWPFAKDCSCGHFNVFPYYRGVELGI